jgi:predicted MPP superfamily phosphohydrolase
MGENMKKKILAISILALLVGCNNLETKKNMKEKEIKLAFMPDIHFHDVYGQFQDNSFHGIKGKNGKNATIRTMEAQLTSTRLFNENYFAFLAALEDAREKGIKYIVLPGDFSDDGQPINLRGIKKIMDEYTEKYGMEFIVTMGNHDPSRPFTIDAGKPDYLGKNGKKQPIFSDKSKVEIDKISTQPIITK